MIPRLEQDEDNLLVLGAAGAGGLFIYTKTVRLDVRAIEMHRWEWQTCSAIMALMSGLISPAL